MTTFERVIAAATAWLLTCAVTAQEGPIAVSVTIDQSKPGASIDAKIYGQFSEQFGRGVYEGIWVGEKSNIPNIRGFRSDVVAALKRLHVPALRWPGG